MDPDSGTSPEAEPSTGTSSDPIEVDEIEIQVGDLVFDARAAGPQDGPTVILLHGFPQTSYKWLPQLRTLAALGYRAVAPDQRGYSPGARPSNIDDYAFPILVDDVLGMADTLGVDRFHLVGHDWGAFVAWGVAAAVPERLKSLSTLSVPHIDAFDAQLEDMSSCQYMASSYIDAFASPGFEAMFLANDAAGLRDLYGDVDPEAIDEYVDELGTEEALGSALNWFRANFSERRFVYGPIGRATVPTLYVWSQDDVTTCVEGAEATEEYVTGPYRFEALEGVDHWIPEMALDRVTDWIVEQIETNEG